MPVPVALALVFVLLVVFLGFLDQPRFLWQFMLVVVTSI